MNEIINTWLLNVGVSSQYIPMISSIVGAFGILLLVSFCYYLVKHRIVKALKNIVEQSKNTWDDLLIHHHVFIRIAQLIPFILLLFLVPLFLPLESVVSILLITFAKVAICFQVARCFSAMLNVIKSVYERKARERYLPLNASIQIIKLSIYLIASILAIAFILDRSPIYLLSGLGALTAVLLLVFQDTIKGFVASIQIAANKMVAPGDWVEIPQYGADGDVLEIGLSTVKIQNFDRTVTTVPTYALISGSFKNWRDMFNSGGRRIKRALYLDIRSVKFYTLDELNDLKKFKLLSTYLETKQEELAKAAKEQGVEIADVFNARQLTNIGTFRIYVTAYLKKHAKIHKDMTCMVRQLPVTPTGIPLEVYCFSNDQNWVNYEGIQADIFDHLYAIAPQFGLRLFQHPSGYDWNKSE